MNRIEFYREEDAYGCFSNFSPHPIELDGRVWPTTEHYFQAQKYVGTPKEEQIRLADSPGKAAKLGRTKDGKLRGDWEQVKEAVMERCVLAKFTQHADLGAVLLATGDAELVEHTRNDRYGADGGDGTGKNRLGFVLERVRCILRGRTLAAKWPTLLRSPTASFVLFEHGTCVVGVDVGPEGLAAHATRTLVDSLPMPGGPAGDFAVQRLDEHGCLVCFDDPDVLVLLLPGECGDMDDLRLGLRGRDRLHRDASSPRVAHVVDRRANG